MNIVRQLREKDRLFRELERARLEKEVMEKVLKINLSETVESSVAANKPVTNRVDCEQHVLRIDITNIELRPTATGHKEEHCIRAVYAFRRINVHEYYGRNNLLILKPVRKGG